MPASPECPECLSVGIHSRVKRLYYRLNVKYSEVGWLCPSCMRFYPDWGKYVEDYNRIFQTNYTVESFKEQVWAIREQYIVHKHLTEKEKKEVQKARRKYNEYNAWEIEQNLYAKSGVRVEHHDISELEE